MTFRRSTMSPRHRLHSVRRTLSVPEVSGAWNGLPDHQRRTKCAWCRPSRISVENPPCIGSELMSAPHVPTGLTPVGCCCLSGIRPRAGKTVEIHPVRWGSTHRQPSPVPRGFESSLRHVSNRRGPLEGVVVPPRSLWCGVHPAFVLEKHVSAGAGRSSCGRHRSAASVQAARRHRAAGCRQRLVRSARRNPVCTSAGTLAVCRGVQIPISECLPRYGTESRTSDLDESPPGGVPVASRMGIATTPSIPPTPISTVAPFPTAMTKDGMRCSRK